MHGWNLTANRLVVLCHWFRLQHLLDHLFDERWFCLGLEAAPAPGWLDDALQSAAYPTES